MMPKARKRDASRRISVFGTGYVGIVTAATFASRGHEVVCVDVIPDKVALVNSGISPVHEPGVDKALKKAVRAGRLRATTDAEEAVKGTDISFICVGTPSGPDGTIDLAQVRAVAADIGKALGGKRGRHLIIVKSTVVPSTTVEVVLPIIRRGSGRKVGRTLGLACNPEFLREGSALRDSMRPDRVVIGAVDKESLEEVEALYPGGRVPIIRTDPTTAEMVKYVSNAFLAARIALANEVANICSAYEVDVYEVMRAVGLDERIGPHFLRAGAGFGGSCFPKDVRAMVQAAREEGVTLHVLPAVLQQNEFQPLEVVRLLREATGGLKGKVIALLGVAFKPDTDDVRETRALPMAVALLKAGTRLRVYDPNHKALVEFTGLVRGTAHAKIRGGARNLSMASDLTEALDGADGCLVQTEWAEFRKIPPSTFKRLMKRPVVVDGRRTFDPEAMLQAGIDYSAVGWKNR